MRTIIFSFLTLIISAPAWCLGAPYDASPSRGLFNTTSSVNQFTTTNSQPGDQQQQWEQEEEDLELTEKEKNRQSKIKERQFIEEQERQEQSIENHRFDVPNGNTYHEE